MSQYLGQDKTVCVKILSFLPIYLFLVLGVNYNIAIKSCFVMIFQTKRPFNRERSEVWDSLPVRTVEKKNYSPLW